jgi:hypothetical protein
MNKASYLTIRIITWILILVIVPMMTGCSGYKHFDFKNIYGNFSFEYPASYHIVYVHKRNDSSIALIQLKSPQDQDISIDVMTMGTVYTSSIASLEYDLNFWKKGQNEGEFEILDQSRINIDDTTGEKIVYSYYRHPEATVKEGQRIIPEKIHAITYRVYFQHDELFYQIIVECVFR